MTNGAGVVLKGGMIGSGLAVAVLAVDFNSEILEMLGM